MGPPDPRAQQNNRAECDILVSKILGFKTFPIVLIGSVSVLKKFSIEKSIGIGFEIFWYRKKYRYRFRKILVSKKVSVSVSKKLVSKKVSVSVLKNFGLKKSIGFENFDIEIGHKYL